MQRTDSIWKDNSGNDDQYLKTLESHLSVLTSQGLHYAGIVENAAALLQSGFLNETELRDDEKRDLLAILIDTTRKHRDLIERSIRERQSFFDSLA